MSRRLLALIAVGGATVMAVAVWWGVAGGAKGCSKVGCVNVVSFDLASLDAPVRSRAAAVTLCANGECTTTSLASASIDGVGTTLRDPVVRSASLAVVDASGRLLLQLDLAGEHAAHESRPNGPACEPRCWYLGLAVSDGALTTR